jgi:hypothetical protein
MEVDGGYTFTVIDIQPSITVSFVWFPPTKLNVEWEASILTTSSSLSAQNSYIVGEPPTFMPFMTFTRHTIKIVML